MKGNRNLLNGLVTKLLNETIHEKAEEISAKIKSNLKENSEVCECGAPLYEGECLECGGNKNWMDEELDEDIYDETDEFPKHQSFDYVEEVNDEDMASDYEERVERFCNKNSEEYNSETCNYLKNDFLTEEMSETLFGKQNKLDVAKPKGKLTSADFAKLRGGKKETKEGKKFPDLTGDGEVTYADILKGRGVKIGKKSKKGLGSDKVDEAIRMTESEMIDFIEKIIKEDKLKSFGQTKGLNVYKKAHAGSGKENDDYLKSVTKKMKDYLKDGSKGEYDTNPEIFPKGNGELAKMSKKAYIPSNAVQDYTDNLTAAGQENIDYDEIHPSEEWVTANVEGSSKTGNNPDWANTGKSDVNKKRNKIRKDNMLAKIKRKAYNKAPQPVVDSAGEKDDASKLMVKLESKEELKKNKLNEELNKIGHLTNYNKKTQ